MRIAAGLALIAACGGGDPSPIRVEMFTRTEGFRHDSIPPAKMMIDELAAERGWVVSATEEQPSTANADVVLFLLTSGDVLDPAAEAELEAFVRGGGGWVGVHSAADTEYDWAFYAEMLGGAHFLNHPVIQPAVLHVEAADHPAARHLPEPWSRTDEWYDFRMNPRGAADVILTIDETTYTGGMMGADHPIAWSRSVDAGRAFYTALGHTIESYSEPDFRLHVAGGIEWAAGR
jgi:type 1 glutamine amidotransferase